MLNKISFQIVARRRIVLPGRKRHPSCLRLQWQSPQGSHLGLFHALDTIAAKIGFQLYAYQHLAAEDLAIRGKRTAVAALASLDCDNFSSHCQRDNLGRNSGAIT